MKKVFLVLLLLIAPSITLASGSGKPCKSGDVFDNTGNYCPGAVFPYSFLPSTNPVKTQTLPPTLTVGVCSVGHIYNYLTGARCDGSVTPSASITSSSVTPVAVTLTAEQRNALDIEIQHQIDLLTLKKQSLLQGNSLQNESRIRLGTLGVNLAGSDTQQSIDAYNLKKAQDEASQIDNTIKLLNQNWTDVFYGKATAMISIPTFN